MLRIQVGGGFVDQINVRGFAKAQGHGHTLQFSSRQVLDLLIDNVLNLQRLHAVSNELRVDICVPDFVVQQLANSSRGLGRNLLGFITNV